MLKKISYTKRLKYLPWIFFVALLLIYWIAIRDTFLLKSSNESFANQAKQVVDAQKQINELNNKRIEVDSVACKEDASGLFDPVLGFISHIQGKSNGHLIDYKPTHVYQNKRFEVETRSVVFEGGFSGLLQVLFTFEKKYKSGKVVSVNFNIEKNFKTEKKRLLMTMYIQSVKSNEKYSNESNDLSK